MLALLAHPNIVPIYDIVWEDGLPLFYSMKLVKGRTLQQILQHLRDQDPATLREFSLDRLLLIFRQVCDAIAFAHSKGVLHRDLKPENVMVGEFGELLVMDWGLAKLRHDEARMTNEETPQGSSFAIRNSTFRTALQKLGNGEPDVLWTPPNALFRRITISADGSMAAIGSDAGHVDDQEPNVLFLRRSGAQTEMTGTLKIPEAVQRQFRLSPNGAQLAMLSIRRGRLRLFDVASGREQLVLEDRDLRQTQDIRWLNDGRQVIGLTTAKAERGDAGSEEWIVVWDTITGKIVRTLAHATAMDVLVVSPDGRRFAEAGVDKNVRIRDVTTLAVQQEFRAHDGPITAIAWHPSKPIIATASGDLSVKVWNLETGACMEELRGMASAPFSLDFSPSGRRLGCAGNGNPTRIWEPESIGGR